MVPAYIDDGVNFGKDLNLYGMYAKPAVVSCCYAATKHDFLLLLTTVHAPTFCTQEARPVIVTGLFGDDSLTNNKLHLIKIRSLFTAKATLSNCNIQKQHAFLQLCAG